MAALKCFRYMALFLCICAAQELDVQSPDKLGICPGMSCNTIHSLRRLENCTVILGNLHVVLMETTTASNFSNVIFRQLREITGHLLVYRVRGLKTLGDLFPGLARIRGVELSGNYALVVHDMPDLVEIGLYGLLKIDRGGVIVWGSPTTCFTDTLDWNTIAPLGRHVLGYVGGSLCPTNAACRCSNNSESNYCWNNRKCQRFLTGPDAEQCHEQCFGCRLTRSNACSRCRNYTYQGQCVGMCPPNTLTLVNNYCVTADQCRTLDGWSWNNTCTFNCPPDYNMEKNNEVNTCVECKKCGENCTKTVVKSLNAAQAAERCVYIDGSLIIHLRTEPESMNELRQHLARIQEVEDYILIYDSSTITSLDFLPSLRRIGGRTLHNNHYALSINDMHNLQALFSSEVADNLQIGNGTISALNNPMLCASELEKIKNIFPRQPDLILDIPKKLNGYRNRCEEALVDIQVRVTNETTALVSFVMDSNENISYSLLYLRLKTANTLDYVLEGCTDAHWKMITPPAESNREVIVQLVDLEPASSYAICVEAYDKFNQNYSLSPMFNFTTPVGRPPPPFISELVASSPNAIVVRWVIHQKFIVHITHYALDLTLIDISDEDLGSRDQCVEALSAKDAKEISYDFSSHAVLLRPPPDYEQTCESMCGILSKFTEGALVEEEFDLCGASDLNCDLDLEEADSTSNSSFGEYVRALVLKPQGNLRDYEIPGLAPYRDYRIRLRACVGSVCGRSMHGVVRTLAMQNADFPNLNSISEKRGEMSISWDRPQISNGPVLAYIIQVVAQRRSPDLGYVLPQQWCITGVQHKQHKGAFKVRPERADSYLVRICSVTLASDKSCTDWTRVNPSNGSSLWYWAGILMAIVLCVVTFAVSWKRAVSPEDNSPLVENIELINLEDRPCSSESLDEWPTLLQDTS